MDPKEGLRYRKNEVRNIKEGLFHVREELLKIKADVLRISPDGSKTKDRLLDLEDLFFQWKDDRRPDREDLFQG